jgi:SulP family sulfate permease
LSPIHLTIIAKDLFLAPFLAKLALKVDTALAKDDTISDEDNDAVFMATFSVLAGIGICFSGTLLSLSGVFRLANLGSFLPFPVICGFFSAVGILTWTLAVTVDTGGGSIGNILTSGDPDLLLFTAIHHIPSIVVASIMKYLGPKNPFFVVMVVIGTIGLFYAVMLGTGVSLEEAKDMGW